VLGIKYALLAIPQERDAPGERLTTAERQVLALAWQGLSNEGGAVRRGTSPKTVADQLQSIYRGKPTTLGRCGFGRS
jgi:DNA-binding NarL/FixJ family response regulator